MDLVKLVAELREYRAQIEEAIAAMEQLARRRHPVSRPGSEPVDKSEPAAPVRKKKRKASKKKSR